MTRRALNTEAVSYISVASEQICPMCAEGYLIRVRRRVVDRLLSLFVLVHRYRCPCFSCQWEGNLRVHNRAEFRTKKVSILLARIRRSWSMHPFSGRHP